METLILATHDSPGLGLNIFNNMYLSFKQALSGLAEVGTEFKVQFKTNRDHMLITFPGYSTQPLSGNYRNAPRKVLDLSCPPPILSRVQVEKMQSGVEQNN